MKILHIISSLDKAGAETVLYNLCTNDFLNKHSVISLSGNGYYKELLKKKKINVYIFNFKNKNFFIEFINLIKKIKKINPDLVQTWMYHSDVIGGVAAKICNKRVIWNIRNSNLNIITSKIKTILAFITSIFLSSFIPYKIICCSKNSLRYHYKFYLKSAATYKYIANGFRIFINDQKKIRLKTRKILKITDDTFLIGLIARFDPQKNHQFMLSLNKELLKRNIKYKIIFLGKGIEKFPNQKTHKNIFFYSKKDNIFEYISALDLHILPSLYGEAFPNILAECMSLGIPCLSTDIGDSKNIILNKNYLIKSNDIELCVKKVLNLYNIFLSNKKSWFEIQKKCKKKILSKYQISKMIKKYNNVWKK